MNPKEEIIQAKALGDILDGQADAPVAPEEIGAYLKTARFLAQNFDTAPELDPVFDRQLRERLAAATELHAKIVPIFRRPWFRTAVAAAMLFIVLAPSWAFMRRQDVKQLEKAKWERIEKYDGNYKSRLDRLRRNLTRDNGTVTDINYARKRRQSRIDELIRNHKKTSGAPQSKTNPEGKVL